MPSLSRRRFLSLALPATAMLGGCETVRQPTSEAGSTTSTRPTTSSVAHGDPSMLSVGGSVVATPTTERPLTIESTVTNDGRRSVHLIPGRNGGEPLDYLPRFENGAVELVGMPVEQSSVGAFDLATSPVDGCWRFVTENGEEPPRIVISLRGSVEVDPGDTYRVRHHLYQAVDGDECLPTGTYRATTSLQFGEPDDTGDRFPVAYELTMPGDERPTLTVSLPE